MSLDVYLTETLADSGGDVCVHCGKSQPVTAERYSANITHNLGRMAEEAGIYQHCWRPEEIGVTKAEQLIDPLQRAIAAMEADPQRFKVHNSPNGWGLYENFVPWLRRYLDACERYPNAEISVSR